MKTNTPYRSAWKTVIIGAAIVGASHWASGSTNEFAQIKTGGLGGTDWLSYTDKSNWLYPDRGDGYAQEDALGCGYAKFERVAWSTGNGRYIALPASLTLQYLAGNYAESMSLAPVLRGDGEFVYKARSSSEPTSNLGAVWLYTPFAVDSANGYAGFNRGRTEICGPLTRTILTGDAAKTGIDEWCLGIRNGATVSFNYAAYATEQIPASGVRTISDWTMDYQLDKEAAYIFTAPCGSSTNLVCSFDVTAGSPFAKLSTGVAKIALPVGTAVSGSGIAADTYLKRIFPDGSIELSESATATATAALTFAAVTYKATVAGTASRLRVQNQVGNRVVKINKSRAEDEFEVQVSDLTHRATTAGDWSLTLATDEDFLPGRLRIINSFRKHSSGTVLPTIILQDCEVVPPATLANCNALLKVSGSSYTARINVDTDATRPAINASYRTQVEQVAGTLVKTGVGTWPAAFTNEVSSYAGKITVEAGALQVLNDGATLGTVEVKDGATLDISAGGISVSQLVIAGHAIISGGTLTAGSVSGDLSQLELKDGAKILDPASASDTFSVNLVSGSMAPMCEDGDSIAVVVTNSLLRVKGSGEVDLLVVGGGGGAGGVLGGGGGGGGGVLYQQKVALTAGWYSVTVGAGGHGATARGAISTKDPADDSVNGEDSVFLGFVAKGGGAGGSYSGDMSSKRPNYPDFRYEWGVAGGSGGGGGVAYPENGKNRDMPGGEGTAGQGYAGAASYNRGYTNYPIAGGGGGGAGGAATKGGTNELGEVYGSAGGDGLLVPIWGQRYWGGGGGGSAYQNRGATLVAGGKGGGGAGRVGNQNLDGFDGEPNTGGGGGAASSLGWDPKYCGTERGGNGGSGVVILRFAGDQYKAAEYRQAIATGGTILRRREHFIHEFTVDGTFTLNEDAIVDVLVVGGGGGGGASGGGGGGGGSVIIASNVCVKAGAYAVTVGAGGTGQTSASVYATVGGASSVDFGGRNIGFAGSYSAPGGGFGGFRKWKNPNNAGGSGGGGGAPYGHNGDDSSCWSHNAGAAGVEPYGYKGGDATNYFDKATATAELKQWSAAGGGGGGAGGPGGNAWYEGTPSASNRAKGGAGGAGVWCDFRGSYVEYGRGGEGGSPANSNKGTDAIQGTDGAFGTGQGGGGSSQGVDAYLRGGNGGGGVIMIRYRAAKTGFLLMVR